MKNKIFIAGNSRSGTTMTARIIAKNSEILELTELHYFEKYFNESTQKNKIGYNEALHVFSDIVSIQKEGLLNPKRNPLKYLDKAAKNLKKGNYSIITLYEIILDYLTKSSNKLGFVEQTPNNLFYIDYLLKIPNSKIIALIRDPHYVLKSQRNKWKRKFNGGKNFSNHEALRSFLNYNPLIIAWIWKNNTKRITQEIIKDSNRFYLIRFEELTNQPSESVRNLCSFLEMTYSSTFLEIPQIGSSEKFDEPKKIGIKKPEPWRNSLTNNMISNCVHLSCSKEAKLYGYKTKLILDFSIILLVISILILPIQGTLILLFNYKRSKSVIYSIRKRLNWRS